MLHSSKLQTMKTISLVCLLALFCTPIFSQSIRTEVSNPEPRVGQEISIRYYMNELDQKINQAILPSTALAQQNAAPIMSKTITLQDTGVYTLKPIELKFNDETFRTDEVKIHVLEALKNEEGLYARVVKNGNTDLVIIEEIKRGKWDLNRVNERSLNVADYKTPCSKPVFSQLNCNPGPCTSYKCIQNTSGLIKTENNQPANGLFYSLKIYELECDQADHYVLDKEHFTALPKKYNILSDRIM